MSNKNDEPEQARSCNNCGHSLSGCDVYSFIAVVLHKKYPIINIGMLYVAAARDCNRYRFIDLSKI